MGCLQIFPHFLLSIIMVNKMRQNILIIFVFLLIYSTTFAQSADSIYTLTTYGGVGFVRNVSDFTFEYPNLDKGGFLGNLRVMWKPDYLLRIGIEVGRSDLYSVDQSEVPTDSGTTNLQTDVYVWSFMTVFSMSPINNLEINIGAGVGFNTVNNTAFGNESISTDAGSVFMISTGYYFPISQGFKIGAELKGMGIPKYDDITIALQLSFAYKFLEW